MRVRIVLAAWLVVALPTPSVALAEPEELEEEEAEVATLPPEPNRNAVLAYPFAFLRRGFAFAYERAFPARGLSVLARTAYDRQASGDFRSNALGLSLEGRWYFLRRGPFTRYGFADSARLHPPAAVGPFLSARFGFMNTRLRDDAQNHLGQSHRMTWEVGFGLRMAVLNRLDITPFIVGAAHQDYLRRVATEARFTAAFGLALGVLFDRDARHVAR